MTETTAPATDRHEATIERYVEFWNATAAADQQRLAAGTFADGVEYRAPVGVLSGWLALVGFHDQFVGHMGAAAFRQREEPQVHHDRARVKWEIMVGDTSFATGTDVLAFDGDGRIGSVTAFLDRAPEGFDPHAHG